MDNSNLFSHPDATKHVAAGEASAHPAEYPTFSDRPDVDTDVLTPRLVSRSRPTI